MSDAVLCYVSDCWAYFTTQSLAEQWGDDWNDAPHEHNAGNPYEWREYNGGVPWTITKVAFESDLEVAPYDGGPYPRALSVEQINAGESAWLIDPEYGIRPRNIHGVIWAGCTLTEFKRLITERGGKVYVEDAA